MSRLRVQDPGAAGFGVWAGPASWFAAGPLLTASSRCGRDTNAIHRGPHSRPDHLPQASPPNTFAWSWDLAQEFGAGWAHAFRRQPAPCVRRADRVRGPWRSVSWGSQACRPPRRVRGNGSLLPLTLPGRPAPPFRPRAPKAPSARGSWVCVSCGRRPRLPRALPGPSPGSVHLALTTPRSGHGRPPRCRAHRRAPAVGPSRERAIAPSASSGAGGSSCFTAAHGVRDRDGTRRGRLEGAPIHAPRAAGGTPNTRPGSFRAGAPNPPRRGLRLSELTPLGCR